MATYDYSGYKADGSSCRGRIEAASAKEALRRLADVGVFAESVRPLGVSAPLGVSRRASIYRELGALLGAGLPMDRALGLMMGSEDAAVSSALAVVMSGVREGRRLADSVAAACDGMQAHERAALTAAEHSATLPAMLPKVADILESQEQVRERIRSALVYPTFVLVLGVVIATVMLGVVVPRTSAMLADSGLELPTASRLAVAVAKGFAVASVALAVALFAAWAAARRSAARSRGRAVAIDRFLLRLPFMRAAHALAGMRFASTLSALTRSGMPVVDALPIAGASTGRPWIGRCVEEQAEAVRNGQSLSSAISALPHIGREIGDWVRVGEAGGCLEAMLDAAAGRLQREWDRALTRRLALLEPAILAAVGLFVLVLALALILPVVGMARAIGAG
ncbi:MAG: type II secretion system F family protein [Kiritimatiellia bacterium]